MKKQLHRLRVSFSLLNRIWSKDCGMKNTKSVPLAIWSVKTGCVWTDTGFVSYFTVDLDWHILSHLCRIFIQTIDIRVWWKFLTRFRGDTRYTAMCLICIAILEEHCRFPGLDVNRSYLYQIIRWYMLYWGC